MESFFCFHSASPLKNLGYIRWKRPEGVSKGISLRSVTLTQGRIPTQYLVFSVKCLQNETYLLLALAR